MKQLLEKTQNLEVKQAEITAVDIRDGAVCGVCTHLGGYYRADAVIVATGTYLGGRIFVGEASYASGPDGQHAACALTESLRAAGVPLRDENDALIYDNIPRALARIKERSRASARDIVRLLRTRWCALRKSRGTRYLWSRAGWTPRKCTCRV